MSVDIVKFAFVGGEVSKNYYGRADLEKFDLALALAENWFVDYHGGLSTTPGTELVDFVQHDQHPTKFFRFKFSSSVANTDIVLFGFGYIRFIQDGAYVLEDEKIVSSITKASPGIVTSTAHGFETGDWIKFTATGEMTELANRTFEVGGKTDDTFELLDQFGQPLDTSSFTTYVSGGLVSRVYTLVSPYDVEDLEDLRCNQVRDVLRLTHPDYVIHNLERFGQTDWTIEAEETSPVLERPSGLTATPTGGGSSTAFGKIYAVTQVNEDGIESLPSDPEIINGLDNLAGNAGVIISWTPVEGAKSYRVYASRMSKTNTDPGVLNNGNQLGYIGNSVASTFSDENFITPDFSQTPPRGNDPFRHGSIKAINILDAGTSYSNAAVITAADATGSGFVGLVVIRSTGPASGPIAGIIILDGGEGYTDPVFTVTTGTGAELEAELTEASGNYPAVSAVHQQRQVYGATNNGPLTLFGSKPGQLSNFNTSEILLANDSYEHELDSDDVSPINHLIPTRGGLLTFTPAGLWLLSGSGGTAISATNVQADPQAYKGASKVPPVTINTEILYVEATGGKAMLLTYNDINKLYAGMDLSLLANHLVSKVNPITSWAYADEPYKMVWACRQDGVMLNFTIIREQEVFAWTRRTTKGKFLDVISLEEETNTSVYLMVQRKINGRKTKFIERVARRDFTNIEDAFCVDCGLRLGETYPPADLQVEATTGTSISASTNLPVFESTDVDKIIRASGGKMRVVSVVSSTEITVDIIRDIDQVTHYVPPEEPYPMEALAGSWTMDTPVTNISGLTHLEGEAVAVLADGNVVNNLVVEDGAITLPKAATRVVVGLSYRCLAQNLPITIPQETLENKRKRITAIAMRLLDTRGLKAGNSLNALYAVKTRTSEAYGEPNTALNGMSIIPIEPIWNEDTQSYIVQDDPLPATILGYVLEAETGDDTK